MWRLASLWCTVPRFSCSLSSPLCMSLPMDWGSCATMLTCKDRRIGSSHHWVRHCSTAFQLPRWALLGSRQVPTSLRFCLLLFFVCFVLFVCIASIDNNQQNKMKQTNKQTNKQLINKQNKQLINKQNKQHKQHKQHKTNKQTINKQTKQTTKQTNKTNNKTNK